MIFLVDNMDRVVVFNVAEGDYAISVNYVLSIEKVENITPVPPLPEFVKGITNVRGELIPVIDLEKVLYNRLIRESEHNKMIVLRTEELSFAIMVSDAKEIIDVTIEMTKKVGLAAYQKTSYFSDVLHLNDRLIMTIDPINLIATLDGIKEIKEYMKNQPA